MHQHRLRDSHAQPQKSCLQASTLNRTTTAACLTDSSSETPMCSIVTMDIQGDVRTTRNRDRGAVLMKVYVFSTLCWLTFWFSASLSG
jgi:hypothetical protein